MIAILRRSLPALLAPLLLLLVGQVAAQGMEVTAQAELPGRVIVPFGTGERLTYDVKFGALRAGTGSMEVVGLDTVRGREVWHTVFLLRGGIPFYRVDDRYESWFDTRSLVSLRHVQDIDEGRRERNRVFEIFPERGAFSENGKPEQPTVPNPLDDASFLYFVRTLPMSVGQTYAFPRYFRPNRNPVTLRVLRREQITVPAGTFNTIVVQPTIKSGGVFREGGRAELWLSDDERRLLVQLKTSLSIGSINLYLKSYAPGASPIAPPAATAK